ncbi:MAG: hypothetical protein AUJ01_10465 [Acidobacteria bacterium 13_1_40CM_3_65_5]|jgi:hypothetical protein|nr:MAG: hypothetical protein AUH72_17355 [Acidobacteria bacterium 13_1_40CM_4_65_8]OLD16446.1 MAG: hypothetical protein AUJ01_10465 [Acidobacteria bacterium 13_1_40CM_3_65_5]
MDPTELQAKATIAAALIMSHAVEIPALPKSGVPHVGDQASTRLRQLTDYVYEAITARRA